MKVIHFSLTPLAGSPIRIVKSLNSFTEIEARLVVFNPSAYGTRVFEEDFNFNSDFEEIIKFLDKADIVHFHHLIDISHNHFCIDFKPFIEKGLKVIYQFHSTPYQIANGNEKIINRLKNFDFPHLVIPHYPERYFPRARVVPNIVPINDSYYLPLKFKNRPIRISYSPSSIGGAWDYIDQQRWNTKGFPETLDLLKKISKNFQDVKIVIAKDLPHEQCLKIKQMSDIVIDEMVTGSFHLSSLEGLSQGIPTFAYLDNRTLQIISNMTGTDTNPWMNFRLEESEMAIKRLIEDDDLRNEISNLSRSWIEKYWNDRDMINHYVNCYADLLENPDRFNCQRFDTSKKSSIWFINDMNNISFEARSENMVKINTNFYSKAIVKLKKIFIY